MKKWKNLILPSLVFLSFLLTLGGANSVAAAAKSTKLANGTQCGGWPYPNCSECTSGKHAQVTTSPGSPGAPPTVTFECVDNTSVAAQTGVVSDPSQVYDNSTQAGSATLGSQQPFCGNTNGGNLSSYVGQVAGGLTILSAGDFISGLINKWLGVGQPVQDAFDLLIRHYVRAILWGVIASIAIPLIGTILQTILTLSNSVLSLPIITDVYRALVGFINVGFVVALVIMAFATMFKNKKWGIENLPKLIIAAVLINFSFFAAKAVLNIGNNISTITEDAVSGATYNSSESTSTPSAIGTALTLADRYNVATVTCSISSYLNNPNINNSASVSGSATPSDGPSFIQRTITWLAAPLMSVTLGSIITLIWAATLLAITIFFAARFAFIALLVAIMPISWLGFIFPSIKIPYGTIGEWWSQFLRWVFLGPLLLFILYMSRSVSIWLTDPKSSAASVAGNSFLIGPTGTIFQLAAIMAINLIGLYAAVKMSGAASGLITAGVGGGIGWVAKGMNRGLGTISTQNRIRSERAEAAAQAARRRANDTSLSDAERARARTEARGRDAVAGRYAAISRVTSGVALPGQFRNALGKAGIKVPEEKPFNAEEQIKAAKAAYAQRSAGELLELANNPRRRWPAGIPPVEAAALLSQLSEKRELGNIDTNRQTDLLQRAASIGAEKDLLKVRPDLARTINPGIPGVVMRTARKIKIDEVENISSDSFDPGRIPPAGPITAQEELVLGLGTKGLDKRIETGSPEDKTNIVQILRGLAAGRAELRLEPNQQRSLDDIINHVNGTPARPATATTPAVPASRNLAWAALLDMTGGQIPNPTQTRTTRTTLVGPNGQPLP